jgi:hypothetical protein
MCTLSLPSAGADRFARRSRGEAADGSTAARRRRLRSPPQGARLSRSSRRSRRVGRYDAAAHPAMGWPRRGSLAATPEARLPLLGPPLRPRLPWLLAGPPSSRQRALGSVSMRPRGRTRSARRVRCGAHPRRLLERRGCSMCACCDRVSDGILGGDHVGDVQPSGAQLGARMSAQECSGVSDRVA